MYLVENMYYFGLIMYDDNYIIIGFYLNIVIKINLKFIIK